MNINNKILKYVEGQLQGQTKKDFEALINLDSEVKSQVEMLTDLVHNANLEAPPYQLRNKIYDMLNIEDKSFMHIMIEKASGILNVLSGKNHLLDLEPSFITRGHDKSLLFSKNMNDYKIFCDFYLNNNKYLLNLGAYHIKNNQVNNIKFTLEKDLNILLEKFTNSDGATGSFEIAPGTYYIEIDKNQSPIGNIKINIS